jgi:tungsten cofactor oxidoreducase radical SAM maturase
MQEYGTEMGKICLEERTDLKYLFLEITNRCNLNCKMCFKHAWSDREGDMSPALFDKLLDDAGAFNELRLIYFGGIGEPFAHPQFMEMLGETIRRGYRVGLSTNGTLLTETTMRTLVESQVDLIYFSLDVIPMMPTEIGHAIPEDTIKKIRRLKEIKEELSSDLPHIGVEVVITRENHEKISALTNTISELGINALIFSNLLPSLETFVDKTVYGNSLDISDQLHEIYLKSCEDRGFLLKLPEFSLRTERHCDFIEKKTAVVRWDGEVAPCYRFLHTYPEYIFGRRKDVSAHSFGNVGKKSLEEIWTGRDYLWFRYMVTHALYPSCTDCSLVDACAFASGTEMDCRGNMPSCGDCLWARKIVLCPVPVESFGKFR